MKLQVFWGVTAETASYDLKTKDIILDTLWEAFSGKGIDPIFEIRSKMNGAMYKDNLARSFSALKLKESF